MSRQRITVWIGAVLLVIALPFLLGEGYNLHLLILGTIFAIVAVGLDVTVGYAGLLSLGHAAFFGLGAYTSALLFLHYRVPMWGGMIGGAVVAGFAAFLLGFLILNVRGHRFVISTVAFAEIMRLVAYNWTDLTHGQRGLPGILAPVVHLPWGGTVDFGSKTAFFFAAVVIAAICIGIMWRIVHSPLGDAFVALRENEHLAELVGIDARRHAILAFTIGGFFAGIGGSLYAHYVSFVGPDVFYFSYTTIFLVMVVTGGMGSIVGPVIGALVFTLLPEYLRITEGYRLIFFGTILVLVMLFLPNGMYEIWTRRRSWLRISGPPTPARSSDA